MWRREAYIKGKKGLTCRPPSRWWGILRISAQQPLPDLIVPVQFGIRCVLLEVDDGGARGGEGFSTAGDGGGGAGGGTGHGGDGEGGRGIEG